MNRLPAQDPDRSSYFTLEEVARLEQALESYQGLEREGFGHPYYGEGVGSLFIYPANMS